MKHLTLALIACALLSACDPVPKAVPNPSSTAPGIDPATGCPKGMSTQKCEQLKDAGVYPRTPVGETD